MDSTTVPQVIANASLGGVTVVIALLTVLRVALLIRQGRTRRALAEILVVYIAANIRERRV